ncbi:MAG: DNA cytosine methyltransferase [Bacteroides xylanisolvens]
MTKYKYNWNLKDTKFTRDKGKVFSCFSCGGGSTMGYKLAGFDVIGCNEIDPKMMDVYIKNHNPAYPFLAPIQEFKNYDLLPDPLFNLDILDGSPPCSSFSTAGVRERDWGVKRKFKEGQAKQILDTLFFDFIDLTNRLQPKVVIAENVKGILLGNARKYAIKVYEELDKAGYYVQHFLLDASAMGVPQRRERVFFIGLRKDLASPFIKKLDFLTEKPFINLRFIEDIIPFGKIETKDNSRKPLIESYQKYYEKANEYGVYDERSRGGKKIGYFRRAVKNLPLATIMTSNTFSIDEKPAQLNDTELALCSTFPMDYDYLDNDVQYIVGMSVPPVMIAQIADRVYEYWLSKINMPAQEKALAI